MRPVGVATAYISVEGFYPMDQTGLKQKIQSPINCGRRCPSVLLAQLIKNIVGFNWLVAIPD
jgi:hypothetical protein